MAGRQKIEWLRNAPAEFCPERGFVEEPGRVRLQIPDGLAPIVGPDDDETPCTSITATSFANSTRAPLSRRSQADL